MRYILVILILSVTIFLLVGCSSETTKTSDNLTNETPEEPPVSSSIVIDEPWVIDVEKETVTVEIDSGRVFKTLRNESNRTVELFVDEEVAPKIDEKILVEELAKHNYLEDCWVAYKSAVYDITSWLPRHPGSAAAIVPYCGTSSEFEQAFTNQHGTSKVNKLIAEGEFKGNLE